MSQQTPEKKPHWNAVFAVSLCASSLIMGEFLPASLITPMAKELLITNGTAGQAISVTAFIALFSSLFISILTKGIDRRWVLIFFAILQIISNFFVAFAPNFIILMMGRVILGIGIGGFWSMSASIAMRLVPEKQVPKALSIILGAVSVATVVAAPLGSYLGSLIGWRNVFLVAAALGILAFIWQILSLPSMPAGKPSQLSTLVEVLKHPNIPMGMFSVFFVFAGNSLIFSYLRPFLETITHINDPHTLSLILLGFGLGNFIGTSLAGYPLEKNLKVSIISTQFLMCLSAAALVFLGRDTLWASLLITLFGFGFGIVVVGWSTWLTRTVPDKAESGGGILVATIQLAITLGAAFGGFVLDHTGAIGVFILSSLFLLGSTLTARFTN